MSQISFLFVDKFFSPVSQSGFIWVHHAYKKNPLGIFWSHMGLWPSTCLKKNQAIPQKINKRQHYNMTTESVLQSNWVPRGGAVYI